MIEPPPSDGIHYNPANNSANLNGNTGTGNSVNSGNDDDISGVEYRIQLLVSNLVATVRGDLLHPYLQWPLQCQCIPTKSQEEFREANELAMRISSEIQVWNPHETQVNLFNYNFSLQVPSPSLSHLFETYEFRCFRFGSEVIRVGDYIRIRSNKFNHKYMDPNTNLTIMHIHKIIDISDLVKAEMLVIIGRVYQRQQTFSVTIDTDLLMPAWIPVSPNGLDQDLFVIQFDDIIGRYYPVKSALVNFKKGSLKKRDWRMWSDVDDDCTAAMGINFENDFIVDDENVLIEDDSDLGITIDSGIILKSFFDEHSNIQELNKTDQEDTKPDNQLEKQVKGEKPQEILMSSIPLISSLVSQFFDLTQPLISNDSLRKILYAREQNRNVQTKMLASHHIILKDFLTRMSKHDFSKLFMFELTIISQLFHLGLTDFEEPISIGTMMTDLGVHVDQCVYKNPVEFATKNHQRLFDIGTVFSHFWFEEWTSLRFSLDKITQASGYTTVLRHIDVQKSLIKKQHVSLEDLPTEIVEWLKMDHIDSTKSVHTSKRSLNQTLNRVTVKRVCLPPTYRQLGPGINSRIDNDQVSLVKVLSLPFRKAFSAFDHFIEDLEFIYNDNDTETVLDYKPGNDYQLEKSAQSFPIPSVPIATGVKFVQGKIHWVGHLGYDSEGRLRTASETPCELNLYLYTSINGKSKKCTLSKYNHKSIINYHSKFTNHFQKYSEFQIIKLTKDSRIKKKTLQYVENNEFKNPMTMNDEINTSPLLFQAKPAVLHDVQYLKLRDMMTDSVVAIWRNKYYEGVLFSGTNLFYMVATVGRLSIQKLYPDLIYT
ncbi:hypothetical protein HDV02_002467 [Globomyces sp. JEL0801]|nr:hypothetical protein HDV02_002467 [Globomyces sp. JEL0801]